MGRKHPRRRHSLHTSGNAESTYVDEAQTVLVNKLGIGSLVGLQIAEEMALASAYESLFQEVRVDTPLTAALVQEIHARIFGEIYAWAGRWRTVWIRKPGMTWPPPDFLGAAMEEFEKKTLKAFPANELRTDDEFCHAASLIQGEFLVIHPFREGNARTVKLLTNLLAAQTSRPPLVYDSSPAGIAQYIAAAQAAFKKSYDPMVAVIRTALDAARKSP